MNTKRLAQTLLGTVQAWVEPAFKAVFDRMDAIEQRFQQMPAPEKGEPGPAGPAADPEAIRLEIARQVADIPKPQDGKDADPEAVAEIVLARIPKPKDGEPGAAGKDAEPIHPDTLRRLIGEEVKLQVDAIPKPQDGKDAKIDLEWLERLITLQVQTRFDALPRPENGKDADMDALRAAAREFAEAAVMALPKPQDGAPGKDADPVDPEMVRTMVRLAVDELPPAAPGRDGENGQDVTDEQVLRLAEPLLARMVAEIPRPEPGSPGEPGKDADPDLVRASAKDAVVEMFTELADELMRGLEEDVPAPVAPSLNIHVNGPDGKQNRPAAIGTREQTVLIKSLTETLRETLMLPVKPVYDEKTGKLLYGQRVAKVE